MARIYILIREGAFAEDMLSANKLLIAFTVFCIISVCNIKMKIQNSIVYKLVSRSKYTLTFNAKPSNKETY